MPVRAVGSRPLGDDPGREPPTAASASPGTEAPAQDEPVLTPVNPDGAAGAVPTMRRGGWMANATETTTDRAHSVQQVLEATTGESSAVKQAALSALVPPPGRTAADIVWIVLVCGLVVLLVLAILGLTHVLGHTVNEDKIVTIFTTVLAGLLGLFAKSPGSS